MFNTHNIISFVQTTKPTLAKKESYGKFTTLSKYNHKQAQPKLLDSYYKSILAFPLRTFQNLFETCLPDVEP